MNTLPLFLSDIAGSEILLILLVVLMFFGSKSIPGIARTMGRTIRQIKDASQEVQNEIRQSGGDIRTDFNLQRMMNDTTKDIEQPFREHARTLDQALNFDPPSNFVEQRTQAVPGSTAPLDQVAEVSAVESESKVAPEGE